MQTMQELQARIDEIRTGSVPINTKKNDAWVKRRYNEWAISRQGQGIDIPLTIDNLRPIRVNQVLPLFFTELKKKDHTNYNIKSVYSRGHRTEAGLNAYKRPTKENNIKIVSNILTGKQLEMENNSKALYIATVLCVILTVMVFNLLFLLYVYTNV